MAERVHEPRGRTIRVLPRLAVAMGACALLAACSPSQSADGAAASSPPAQSAPAAPSPSAPAAPPAAPIATTSPYSGRDGGIDTPVLVVKYDNTPAAQPHRGLTAADVVYLEEVEWGLTRIAAVFSTEFPEVVGPVRSARVSDIDLFAQYGPVAFVYSGAQSKLNPRIAAADWIPISQDLGSAGFHRERGTGRYAPTNLMADPAVILDDVADEVAHSSDMGWVFDTQRPSGGTKVDSVAARWPNSRAEFRWNAKKDAWDVWMNGREARDTDAPKVQRASTVIVQYVKQKDSGYGDKFGGRTPMVVTVGSGKGLLLRDGRSYPITWERPTESAPTAYLDASGEPIALAPGQVWIALMDRTRKVSVES